MAIRANRRSIPSTGSSASRSPKHAITSSGSWKTSKSTARGSTRRSTLLIERRPEARRPCLQITTGRIEPADQSIATRREGSIRMAGQTGFDSVFVRVTDGLKLHARDYGDRAGDACRWSASRVSPAIPIDFHDLALALSAHKHRPRRVVALDYRGRGLSDCDANWKNYDPRVEAADTIAMLTPSACTRPSSSARRAAGLSPWRIAAMQPARIRGVVLNDIGPVIDARGTDPHPVQVGKLPAPRNWAEAVDMLKHMSGSHFPALSDDDWDAMARGTWQEDKGRRVPCRDQNLMKGLEGLDLEAPLPALWSVFEGLTRLPVLAIRGENSDLLSRRDADGDGSAPSRARALHRSRPGPCSPAARFREHHADRQLYRQDRGYQAARRPGRNGGCAGLSKIADPS